MMDNIEPLSAVVALTIIVAIWLGLGIRDRRRARLDAERRAAVLLGMRAAGLCAMVWPIEEEEDVWVVCARAYEHTGPHLDHSGQHLRR